MTNAVQIAAQLYECRDAARTLLGDKFPERMREYGDSIRSVATVKGCGELEAGKMLAEAAGGGMTSVLVLAATVEIIEPSVQARPNELWNSRLAISAKDVRS